MRARAAYPNGDGEAGGGGGGGATFPTMSFDLLPNGGASQTHPHVQPHLVARRYPGKWEAYRRAAGLESPRDLLAALSLSPTRALESRTATGVAACAYAARHGGASLYADVARLHAHLGLVVRRTRHFVAFVALTSAGSGPQIELLGDAAPSSGEAAAAALAEELGGLLHEVLSAAQQALGWDAISASCAFPPSSWPMQRWPL